MGSRRGQVPSEEDRSEHDKKLLLQTCLCLHVLVHLWRLRTPKVGTRDTPVIQMV